jgi:polysaccharide export outer membrane protein
MQHKSAQSASLLAAALLGAVLVQQPAWTAPGEYALHAGDTIEVSVWKELDLQRQAIIRPDGKFSFPLAGELEAAGRTPTEIRQEIENRLKVYIPEPVVTVTVLEVGGNRIYVIGQVKKPGTFVMNPQLNVVQALSLAEGTTPFAKLDDIIVIRNAGGTQRVLPFRYSDVASGKNLQQNILLESGDVVLVP